MAVVDRKAVWRATIVFQAALLALAGAVSAVLAVIGTGTGCASGPQGATCGHSGQGLPWIVLAPCLFALAATEVRAALRPRGLLLSLIRLVQLPIGLAIVVAEAIWAMTRFNAGPAFLGLVALFIALVVAIGPPGLPRQHQSLG
jgi:hypothetical protein